MTRGEAARGAACRFSDRDCISGTNGARGAAKEADFDCVQGRVGHLRVLFFSVSVKQRDATDVGVQRSDEIMRRLSRSDS